MMSKEKLTMEELLDRLDAEFYDVDLTTHDSPTKGTVAVVHFYEEKNDEWWLERICKRSLRGCFWR